MKTPRLILALALALSSLAGCQSPNDSVDAAKSDLNESIQRPISTEQVARIDLLPEDEAMGADGGFYPPANVVVSPDGKHVAYPARDAGGWYVALDDKKGPYFKMVGGPIVFSPDSTQLAYRAYLDDGVCVVINGKQSEVYPSCGMIAFSGDSRHVAFSAKKDNKSFWVIDGASQKPYDELGQLVFNNDGSRYAYPASSEGQAFIVENGIAGKSYDFICDGPVYSPDGKRMAYSAGYGKAPPADKTNDAYDPSWNITFQKTRAVAIIDGVEQTTTYGHVYGFKFSPDSKRLAFVAAPGTERFVVLDGVAGPDFLTLIGDSITFSPDSARIMYTGSLTGEWYMIVDDKMFRAASLIGVPVFSADNKRTAWLQERLMGNAYMILDGKAVQIPRANFRKLPSINESGLAFTPDAQRVVYMVKANASEDKPGYAMVLNDRVIHWSFGLLGNLHISPDGTVEFLEFADKYHSLINRVTLKLP